MPLNRINWRGRAPQIKNVISPRVVWAGGAFVIIALVAVYFGFKMRIDKKQALEEKQQTAMVGSDSAPSTRHSVEPGLNAPGEVPESSLGATAVNAAAGAVKAVANPFATNPGVPAAWQNAPAPTTGGAMQAPSAAVAPQYMQQPISYAPQEAGTVEDFRRQEKTRLMQEEIDAREAPTGVDQQRMKANKAAAVTSPMQPGVDRDLSQAQAQLARLQDAAAGVNGYGAMPTANAGNEPHETGYQAQNGQADKRKFNEGGDGMGDDYLKTTRVPAISPWVLQRGTEIPMILPAKISSDLPGDLQATVSRDVLESIKHRYIEIPAGSIAIFEYNSSISYGQNRVQAVCTAIYFPDGSHIDLDRMPAHSADGTTGLKDKVDNHYKRLFGSIALTSILAAGVQISQNRNGANSLLQYPSIGQEIGSSVGEAASQAGSQLMSRNLNIQPTVWIRPGEPFSLWVKKDIVFPGPYEPMEPLGK